MSWRGYEKKKCLDYYTRLSSWGAELSYGEKMEVMRWVNVDGIVADPYQDSHDAEDEASSLLVSIGPARCGD